MTARNPCAQHADCLNTDGSFTCVCETGYLGDGYKGPCTWINTPCPAGQYLKGTAFTSGCADLPFNAKESNFHFNSIKSFFLFNMIVELKGKLI